MPKVFHKDAFDRISPERRKKIIDVSVKEFADYGFENANINTIASKAGVSVGSIYKYFDTKEALFLTCVHHGVNILEEILEDIMVSPEDILIKAEKIIRHIQSYSRSRGELIKLYNEMTSESNSELVWKLASDSESVSAKIYTSLIRQAQQAGIVRDGFSPEMFAFFLDNLFMMLQFSYSCDYYRERFKIYAGNDITEKDDFVVEQLLNFIKSAFKNTPQRTCGSTGTP